MLLTRLKHWRELRGYSLRELAEKSTVPYSAISLLENLKREPQGRTARKLAAALAVEVTELYDQTPAAAPEPVQPTSVITLPPTNDNKTQTAAPLIKPARSTRGKQKKPAGNCWVIDEDSDAFGPFIQAEADRLKGKLGKARVYEAGSRFEAQELHRKFLIRVIRGHDAW
jgi:transcriptional regulator with XRE-family HTH domain